MATCEICTPLQGVASNTLHKGICCKRNQLKQPPFLPVLFPFFLLPFYYYATHSVVLYWLNTVRYWLSTCIARRTDKPISNP